MFAFHHCADGRNKHSSPFLKLCRTSIGRTSMAAVVWSTHSSACYSYQWSAASVCVCVCVSLPLTQPLLREQAGKTWGSLQRPILSNAFYCSDDAASCGRCSHLSWKLHEAALACVYDSDATIWHILTLQRKVPLAVEFGLHGNKLVVMHIGKGKMWKREKGCEGLAPSGYSAFSQKLEAVQIR